MGKKVLIITGSPRQKGNTNALAAAFASGAVAAGNEVEVLMLLLQIYMVVPGTRAANSVVIAVRKTMGYK